MIQDMKRAADDTKDDRGLLAVALGAFYFGETAGVSSVRLCPNEPRLS
jgi:hypothetical protein